jgi:hypothetical protein
VDIRGEGGALGQDRESVGELSDVVLGALLLSGKRLVALERINLKETYLEGNGVVVGGHAVGGGVGVHGVEHSRDDTGVGAGELSSLLKGS